MFGTLNNFKPEIISFHLLTHRIKGGRKQISPMDTKLRQLYDAIRDYREPKANRQLALIFMKLPSKTVSESNHILVKLNIEQSLLYVLHPGLSRLL